MASFVGDASQPSRTALELPRYTKLQRQQVRALAAVFGLEPRACGRVGQTLFKTKRAGPLTAAGEAQAQRLLACSITYGRPTAQLAQEMQAAMNQRTTLTTPIAETNKGSQMLRQMGWSQGMGLGVRGQGIMEPVPVALKHNRHGLGH
ncbi:hypothetical protein WJX72_001885 [[Myrmecia] bisecta]